MKIKMYLHLFDGAGAPAAAPAGETAGDGAGEAPKKIVYGIQETKDSSPEPPEEPAEESRESLYKKSREEFKDLFQQEIDGIINKRIKETRGLSESLEKVAPLMDMLSEKYGIKDSKDFDSIVNAYMNDPEQYRDIAEAEGLSLEQAKHMRELENFKRAQSEAQNRANADATYQNWMREANELAEVYPEFDIYEESNNPQFTKLLQNGIPVKQAYEVLHPDALTMRISSEISQKQAGNIAARQKRPAENGLASKSGIEIRNDVSKFTAEDRRRAIRQSQQNPGSVRFS